MHGKGEKMYTRINFISHSGGEKKRISYQLELQRNLLFYNLHLLLNSASINVCALNSPRSDGALKPQDYKNEEPSQNHKGKVSTFPWKYCSWSQISFPGHQESHRVTAGKSQVQGAWRVTALCPWKNTTSDSGNNLPNSLSILCTRSCFHWRGQERLLCHLLFHPRIGLSPVFNSSPQENINIVEHSNFTGSGDYLRILLRCKIEIANWGRPWNIAFW